MKFQRVYLAGPGVFRTDADAYGAELVAECERYGLSGIWPGAALSDGSPATSQAIFRACLAQLDTADAMVADISPFRGPHADDGTAWEIGYAFARGLPVFAWTSDTDPLAWRIPGTTGADGTLRDAEGHTIEDFAAPANLMIVEACESISGTAEDAISCAARHFRTHVRPVSG